MFQRFLHFIAQILILVCLLFTFLSLDSWSIGAIDTLSLVIRLGVSGGLTHVLFHACFPQQQIFSYMKPNSAQTSKQKAA